MTTFEVFFPQRELAKDSEPVALPEELKGVSFELFWDCDEEVRNIIIIIKHYYKRQAMWAGHATLRAHAGQNK